MAAGTFDRLGPYRLVHRLGEGGMGVVYLALDRHGRAVAIKVLRPHIAHDPDARSRLEREVETLSRIADPRVAPVVDADILGERPYIVTRYVPGPSLDEVVGERGAFSARELLQLGRGLVTALDAIHRVGVIHRDLKPGNVLIEDGEPVVIDFGIAHVADDVRLTSVGLVMGTPGYLAPEVIEGAGVTEATDWWGWAATLAFAASGRPPFGRGPMDVVLDRVRRGQADLTGVDERLTPLLAAALAPDPRRRPPAPEVVAALQRYAVGAPATVAFRSVPGTGSGDNGSPPWAVPLGADPTLRHTSPPPVGVTSALPAVEPPSADPGWARDAGQEWDDSEEDSDWQAAWDAGPDEPDPRIGRPDRTGTLAALTALAAAGAATRPGIAVLAVVAWSVLARFSDRSVTALVMRRFDRGRRRSDVPLAIVLSPWHVIRATLATAVAVVLPGIVAVSAAISATLVISNLTTMQPGPARAPELALGFLGGAVVAWWGPGSASLRRGSRSLVRGSVPSGTATDIVVGVLVAAALGLAFLALARQGDITWWPLSGDPGRFLQASAG